MYDIIHIVFLRSRGAKLNLNFHIMINNAIISKYCTAVSIKYKPLYIICLMCFSLFILIHPVRNS